MENTTLEIIADKWIKSHSKSEISEFDEIFSDNDPDTYLDIILSILDKIDANEENPLFSALAVDPLEDLLQDNGDKVINRVVNLARQNPDFRKLLNGVWDSEFQEPIKTKLAKYLKNRW